MGNGHRNIPNMPVGRGTIFWLPEEACTTPANGECIVDHWWSVDPDKGLSFYAQLTGYAASEDPSPQCNQSEGTCRLISGKMWPTHDVRKIPVVYMNHAQRAMRTLRASAIEARSDKTAGLGPQGKSAVGESRYAQDQSASSEQP